MQLLSFYQKFYYYNKLEKDKNRFYQSSQTLKSDMSALTTKVEDYEGRWRNVSSERDDLLSKVKDWEGKYSSIQGSISEKDNAI